jgi:rod shape-determining protein MreD
MSGPLSKIASALLSTVPTLLTILLMIFFTLPIRLPFFELMPMIIAVASVYYWSIYRPELMPVGAVFLIGLVHDFFSGGPFAVMALALLALHLVTLTQRETLAGKTFLVIWLSVVLVGLVPTLLVWIIYMIYFGQLLNPTTFVFQYMAVIILYPLLAEFFNVSRIRLLKI